MGKPIVVRTNYFQLMLKTNLTLHWYDVKFDPEQPIRRKRNRCMEMLLQQPGFTGGTKATDYSSNIISTKKFADMQPEYRFVFHDADETPFPALVEGEPPEVTAGRTRRTIKAVVTPVRSLAFDELMKYLAHSSPSAYYEKSTAIQALNIIVNQYANSAPGVVAAGPSRNKFFPTQGQLCEATDLGAGLIALRGYFSSVRTGPLRTLLNINVASAAFYKPQPVLATMHEFRSANSSMPVAFMRQAMDRFLFGLRVSTHHTIAKDAKGKPIFEKGKPKTITKLYTLTGISLTGENKTSFLSATQAKFHTGDPPKETTVAAYFEKGKQPQNDIESHN